MARTRTTAPRRATLAAIIIAHVEDGLELAEAYQLPSEITDIIGQHHGTSVVTCFYRKAAEADASVFESAFRYPCDAAAHARGRARHARRRLRGGGARASGSRRTRRSQPLFASVVVDARLADGQLAASRSAASGRRDRRSTPTRGCS